MVGDFLGVAASERRGLSMCLALRLVELGREGPVLGDQGCDALLELGADGAEGSVLLTELVDRAKASARTGRPRS